MATSVADHIAVYRRRIEAARLKAASPVPAVTLVMAAKGVVLDRLCQAIDAGLADVGESKIQEAKERHAALNAYAAGRGVKLVWHFIGHLQSNKVKPAVESFDLIHSVDSVSLAETIDKEAAKIAKVQDVLLEVNVAAEASKYGFKADDLVGALERIKSLGHVRVRGLMTIAPAADDPQEPRAYFKRLRLLSETCFKSPVLSMGMTDDFEVAVEEGATMVRIGRGIFGERDS
jgi:pyridoxal phosphate enzyme (YggS family)